MTKYTAEDILIVGAGPAGATASMWFSAHQIPHIIIDKYSFPRDKVCGDAISGKAFSILKQLEPDIAQQLAAIKEDALVTHGITFGAPNGKKITLEFNKFAKRKEGQPPNPTPGFVMKRKHFDDFLFQKLNPSYAIIRQETSLQSIERLQNGQVQAVIKQNGIEETLHPKIVIAADGERSVVSKQLAQHKQSDKHFAAAIRAYYTGVTGFNDLNAIELHYIPESLPGYLWIFPLPNGGCNVGMGMLSSALKDSKRNLRKEMLELLATHPEFKDRFVNAKLEGKVLGWGLPLGSKKRPLSGDNYILTGDAGSLIDPFTGEGIGNAIISGKYAAVYAMEALEANNFSASFFKERYDKMIHHKLWKEFQISYSLQRMNAYPMLINFVFKLAMRSSKMQHTLSMMFVDIDLRNQLKNPMFYIKMLLGK